MLCFPFNSLSLLKRAESQLTPPLLPDRPHRANTNCSWPYVCVSCLDWINFRCGLCLRLLQRVYCESHPHPPTRPPLLPATVPPIPSCVENGHTCTQSCPMRFCTVMGYLKSIHTLRLPTSPFSESGGVILDGGLVINSIKWVWLPWQISLGYNIIISASSAVITGHGSQMRVRLIGREDEVTLDRN